ncbi:hypothetical protein KBC79_06005 [Candidatus Woesebacteria bacterium]|nr:hypothetical protein [Candidatus Woesebacteria bacterium]
MSKPLEQQQHTSTQFTGKMQRLHELGLFTHEQLTEVELKRIADDVDSEHDVWWNPKTVSEDGLVERHGRWVFGDSQELRGGGVGGTLFFMQFFLAKLGVTLDPVQYLENQKVHAVIVNGKECPLYSQAEDAERRYVLATVGIMKILNDLLESAELAERVYKIGEFYDQDFVFLSQQLFQYLRANEITLWSRKPESLSEVVTQQHLEQDLVALQSANKNPNNGHASPDTFPTRDGFTKKFRLKQRNKMGQPLRSA